MQIINIIVIVINIIAIGFISYFKKKGENLATKQDIADITEKIEAVKMEFANQTYILNKKRETYEKIISAMRVFIEDADEQKNQFLDAYSMAWLWANDEVLKKINSHLDLQIRIKSDPSVGQDELKKIYTDCILEMRKDSGYPDTDLIGNDFRVVKF